MLSGIVIFKVATQFGLRAQAVNTMGSNFDWRMQSLLRFKL